MVSLRAHFITYICITHLLLSLLSSSVAGDLHSRRLLHHPFFSPSSSFPPSPSPLSSPHSNHTTPTPKFPFSSSSNSPPTDTTTAGDTATGDNPFFPNYPSQPPPPPPSSALPTFPANISSLALPNSSASSRSHPSVSPKLVAVLVLLSFIAASLLASLTVIIRRKSRRQFRDSPSSSIRAPHPPPSSKLLPTNGVSNTSSEFLYLGTVATSCEFETTIEGEGEEGGPSSLPEVYLKLCGGSPELKPLPPLPKQSFHGSFEANFDDEEFYSPKGFNPSSKKQPYDGEESENFGLKSCISSYPDSNSLENMASQSFASSPSRDSDVSVEIIELAQRTAHFQARSAPPPPAPPPPPPTVTAPASSWTSSGSGSGGPPPLVPPSGPVVFRKSGPVGERESRERKEEMLGNGKPKLKALHWDKVRASSDRVMVWDHLHPGSFQLNEEMIETLFKANGPNMGGKDGARRLFTPLLNEETRVLDPKKSQNIAILLRALNVTEEEVCEALLEGNTDSLGTELLESLLKMAPTKEEERNLKEYKDESPLKLGPAEKFLKAVLDVPFAFKRVDAMLYMATFDSEVEYLRRSFETLEVASQELRNSRMFLKLLEAVLKTGNRMNVGTNRGDALAFKLDTLLKLVDIKGADGKTTLLHFVVQEIIKAEGSRLSHTTDDRQGELVDDVELRKCGLEVVSGLGCELKNVKKAATMDSESLSSDVAKLTRGVIRVNEVLQLNKEAVMNETNKRFSDSINGFLIKAEMEIVRIQSQESGAFSRVKELTEYFHGNSTKEEARPLRIFMVVKDFLSVLDQVCKDVGKVNERTFISSSRPSFLPVNHQTVPAPVPTPFPELRGTTRESSSDDEGFP